MLGKLVVGAAIVGTSFAVGAPTASATPVDVVFGGVYPTFEAAQQACADGIAQGRWWGCSYQTPAGTSPVTYLWVQV
ncbi:hypothetical protein [Actinophytocola sp.]|uniref:hypothetical protein n=1 Tax=Actinophytocola sp. TaxID=1872138 RepID=UPI002D5F5CF9|nr:hypothetical protein [Actinophytocola sp.]HYQ63780.1 hypothetical protein [Actinophytocola sp.]